MNENSFSKGRDRRRKIRSVKTGSPCSLRETIMSTFNSEYGYLNPTTVSVKRCFGGNSMSTQEKKHYMFSTKTL